MSGDNQHDEYRAFLDRMPEIGLMVRDILLNPVPISEQPDILKKLKILFGMSNMIGCSIIQTIKKCAFICYIHHTYMYKA